MQINVYHSKYASSGCNGKAINLLDRRGKNIVFFFTILIYLESVLNGELDFGERVRAADLQPQLICRAPTLVCPAIFFSSTHTHTKLYLPVSYIYCIESRMCLVYAGDSVCCDMIKSLLLLIHIEKIQLDMKNCLPARACVCV